MTQTLKKKIKTEANDSNIKWLLKKKKISPKISKIVTIQMFSILSRLDNFHSVLIFFFQDRKKSFFEFLTWNELIKQGFKQLALKYKNIEST